MKLPRYLANTMKHQKDVGYVLPSSIAASIIFLAIILDVIFGNNYSDRKSFFVISIAIGGSLYVILQPLLVAPRIQKFRTFYIWVNAIISTLGLSLLAITLD